MKEKNVLLAGGSGLIGQQLKQQLTQMGYQVSTLSRSKSKGDYVWDVQAQTIDEQAVAEANFVVHLAGANIGEGRWTEVRKKAIYDSRIKSTALLVKTIQAHHPHLKKFISASAIGIYGNRGAELLHEDSKTDNGFLARVCKDWEAEALKLSEVPNTQLRFGVVLDENYGAFPKLKSSVQLGIGASPAPLDHYLSWIHVKDVVNVITYAIEQESMTDVYNVVAPNPITYKSLMRAMGAKITMQVPSFVLQLALGEMKDALFASQNCSAERLQSTGFEFQYPTIESALKTL